MEISRRRILLIVEVSGVFFILEKVFDLGLTECIACVHTRKV